MGTVAVIGVQAQVGGFALAGAAVHPAGTAEEVGAAWRALQASVTLVVLTHAAVEALGTELDQPGAPLVAVIPS
jgi:vacuolar-type H+-ATPase subunit F/Vma7